IGFAIPISKVRRDLENVKAHGKIIYPFLGVRYTMITKELVEKVIALIDKEKVVPIPKYEYAKGRPTGRRRG
ncbi:MAG: hypothetical protein AAB855_01505, partial [Patescibacteria group bacterium]